MGFIRDKGKDAACQGNYAAACGDQCSGSRPCLCYVTYKGLRDAVTSPQQFRIHGPNCVFTEEQEEVDDAAHIM
jgi:hypothetical protein